MRREEAKRPPYKFFSPATSLKGEFSFDHFAIPSTIPKLLNLNQEHHSKISFFSVKSLKNQVMITSLMKMLELTNVSHMITSTVSFESRDKVLLATSCTKVMT